MDPQRRRLAVIAALILAMLAPAGDRPPPREDSASVAARASQDPPRANPVAHGLSRDPVEPAIVEAPGPSPEPTPDAAAPPTPQPRPPSTPALMPTPAMRAPAPELTVTMAASASELRMLTLVNGSRIAGGLVAVTLDANVAATARAHSAVESEVGYVYHDGPDGTSTARNSAACGSGWYGENTGKVWNGNVDALHIEFMSEPWVPIDHRTITMDPTFRRIGIGAVQGRDALYMTMVFCR